MRPTLLIVLILSFAAGISCCLGLGLLFPLNPIVQAVVSDKTVPICAVLVAKEEIPAGKTLTADLLAFQHVSIEIASKQSVSSFFEISGKKPLRKIEKGEIIDSRCLDESNADSVFVPAGFRSVSITLKQPLLGDKIDANKTIDISANDKILSDITIRKIVEGKPSETPAALPQIILWLNIEESELLAEAAKKVTLRISQKPQESDLAAEQADSNALEPAPKSEESKPSDSAEYNILEIGVWHFPMPYAKEKTASSVQKTANAADFQQTPVFLRSTSGSGYFRLRAADK